MWRLTQGCVHTDYCPESERWRLWITVNLSEDDHCMLQIRNCMQNLLTSSQLHNSVTLVYVLNIMAVLKMATLSKKVHILYELRGIQKDYDSTSSPVRLWKRSLLIGFPAVVVYFCRSVFWIHLYSCAAVNLQANRTHAVTTDSFPLTSRTGE